MGIRASGIAFVCLATVGAAAAQPSGLPVLFTFDDPRDGLWTEGARRAHQLHVGEQVPFLLAYVPCGWEDGVESTNDPFVCRNEDCNQAQPGLRCELGDWARANPDLVEIAQHGLTHDIGHEQLGTKTRDEQLRTISLGLEEMSTWNLPEPPLTFVAPFSSMNADTVSVLEQLGFHTGIKSAGSCAFSTNLELFCGSVPICELDAQGQRVTGPDCVLRSPADLLARVDQVGSQQGRAFLIYHAQDLYEPDLVTIDEQKVADLRAILQAFRSREIDGSYDLLTMEAYYRLVRELPSPGPQGSPVDFDGDGLTDVAAFRSSSGEWRLDFDRSGSVDRIQVYGRSGDIPVPADYDGDGIADFAVYRPSWGAWYVDTNRNGGTDFLRSIGPGSNVPVPSDYDGDGVADLAFFDLSSGRWSVDTNRDGTVDVTVVFGVSGDIPVPGDYDGDGRADPALYRGGRWLVDFDRNGIADLNLAYGGGSDLPVANDYDGDGVTDLAIYRRSWGAWYVDTNRNGGTDFVRSLGGSNDTPVAGDYDGDRVTDLAVFVPSVPQWRVDTGRDGVADFQTVFGLSTDTPLRWNGWIAQAMGASP